MAFEYIPGTSVLHRLDPRTKLFFMLVAFVVSEAFDDPFLLATAFIIIYLIGRSSGIPNERIWRLFRGMIPIFSFLYVLNTLWFSPPRANILLYLIPSQKWLPFSFEAMVYSAGIVIRFAIILISLWLIMLTTPISRFVLGLVKWRLPPSIAIGAGIGLASLPMFIQQIGVIMDALKSRAWEVEYRNPIKKIRAYTPFFIPMFFGTVTRAENIAVAIESRAFGFNIAKRTYWREERMVRRDHICWLLGAVTIVFVLVIGVFGLGYGEYDFIFNILKALLGY